MRILLAVVAIAGFVAVYYTKSRGGFIGLAVGIAALGFMSVLAARKRKAFPFLVIGYPVVLLLFAAFAVNALSGVRRAGRDIPANLTDMLTTHRANMLCNVCSPGLHCTDGSGEEAVALVGNVIDSGTSNRSALEGQTGSMFITNLSRPQWIMESSAPVCSYFSALSATIIALVRTFAKDEPSPSINAARIAGFCGFFSGLFAQSNFEGIFRLPSGAILLGLCLAAAASPKLSTHPKTSARAIFSNSVLTLSGGAALVALLIFGWKGILVSREVWPVYFSRILVPTETRLDRITTAIGVWPLGSLYTLRARTYQNLASTAEAELNRELSILALADYRSAAKLHPFAPELAVNSALLATFLGDDLEAGSELRRAIGMGGEMEAAFNARYYYARYLFAKGLRSYDKDKLLFPPSTSSSSPRTNSKRSSHFTVYMGN